MKTLYVLSGIPGSGKSTWARKFLSEHPDSSYIVSSDDIRKELGGVYQYFEQEELVWKLFYARLKDYAYNTRSVDVIADSTCLENRFMIEAFTQTKNFDKYVLVYFDVDPKISKERNKTRESGKVVRDDVVDKMIKEFEKPNEVVRSIYDEIIVITE